MEERTWENEETGIDLIEILEQFRRHFVAKFKMNKTWKC